MNTNRRTFLKQSALGAGFVGLLPARAADRPASARPASFLLNSPTMKLGMVTYQLGQDWDLETLIQRCEATRFQGVELRTTHAHKVEVNLSKEQREQVRKRFENSSVQLMGLGSAFDYHTPDQAKLEKDITATKEYIMLAHDVGATGVKVRPNALPKEAPKEQTLEQIGKALRTLGEFADRYGIALRLEVHGAGTSLLPNIKTIMDAADHPNVGVCWNSNATDLEGEGFDANFNLVKDRIFSVHLRDLFLEDYPFRKLFRRLNEIHFTGFCLAEIPASNDPERVMNYFRALWLAYQGLL